MSGPVSSRTAGRVPAVLIRTLAVLGAALVLLGAVFVLRGLQTVVREEPRVWEYKGTTWVGDTCYVDGKGVLWCKGGSV